MPDQNDLGSGSDKVRITLGDQQRLVAERIELEGELGEGVRRLFDLVQGDRRTIDPVKKLEHAAQVAANNRSFRRIAEIDELLSRSQLVGEEGCGSQQVEIGSRVSVEYVRGPMAGRSLTFRIGADGVRAPGVHHASGPLPQALMGHCKGDMVELSVRGQVHGVKIVDLG